MREVVLHGFLAKKHGPRFQIDVVSLVDAVRALGAQLPGFRADINDNNYRVIVRRKNKAVLTLDKEQVSMNLPKGDIHIVPVIEGGKKGGFGKIIAGILIAAVAWWNPAGVFAASGMLGGIGLTSGNMMIMGLGIAVAGLGQVLTSAPKADQKDGKNTDSFTLDGVMNVGEQGVPVPLIYGEVMISDVTPISAGMSTSNIPMGASSSGDNVSFPGFDWLTL